MFNLEKLKDNNAIFWIFRFPEFREIAASCGWAIAVHGSAVHDLDLMAMPWVENHTTADELVQRLADTEQPKFRRPYVKSKPGDKPNNRIVYTIFVGDTYIDLNVIEPQPSLRSCIEKKQVIDMKELTIEQKAASLVKQEFEIGDVITNGTLVGEIDEIHELGYHAYFGDHYADVPDIENWHKWTLKDVKDGDILCSGQIILLFKKWESDDWNFAIAHAGIDVSGKLQITDKHWLISNQAHLATREQRHFLIKTMTAAGYTFDFEKKELKKTLQEFMGWSKEDENEVAILEAYIRSKEWSESHIIRALGIVEELVNKAKSVGSKPAWKPTEEQIKALEWQAANTSEGSW